LQPCGCKISLGRMASNVQRCQGFVKNYCPIKGFGLILRQGVRDPANGDFVFLDREEADKNEVTAGAHISFSIAIGEGGRPQARDVNLLVRGARVRDCIASVVGTEINWNKIYVGTVKSYYRPEDVPSSMRRRDLGYGWILCEETHRIFEHDVWAYPSQLTGFRFGDVVEFRLSICPFWSYPCANDIRLVKRVADAARPQGPGAINRLPQVQRAAEVQPTTRREVSGVQPVTCSNPQEAQSAAVPRADRVVARAATIEEASGETENAALATPENSCPDDNGMKPSASGWTKYQLPEGNGFWWYCEVDGESFLEDAPGDWSSYSDPVSGRCYWWKSDDRWFWV